MGKRKVFSHLQVLQDHLFLVIKETGSYTYHSFNVTRATLPLIRAMSSDAPVTVEELDKVLDQLFDAFYLHPFTRHSRTVTRYMRRTNLLPNEKTTEKLIRYVVDQITQRSPIEVPEIIINEFWTFFDELFSEPELKGLVELNLDVFRIILRCYQPLLVELINLLKDTKKKNKAFLKDVGSRVQVIRGDLKIIRRQVRAIRYIKPFFQTDPKDFATQAEIIAKMVREFGPFFIKMAQVAAANSDFLPDEIAKELLVFQEDVPPMTAAEVYGAFEECYGKKPHECYFDFDVACPIKSGSIGSVYLAKKPVVESGQEYLKPVIIKIARKGLDREFLLGKTVLSVAIISTHYWAPHSKLAPFLEAMQQQAEEFAKGFQRELDFAKEAENQQRFAERSRNSLFWNVPEIFSCTGRIIEMEYIESASSINQMINAVPEKHRPKFARQTASRFLYTLLHHVFVYQEFHGDLHPGNVLLNSHGEMFFIDWGNCVNLQGKWKPLWDYVSGALLADVDLLATALINISSNPERNERRKSEIKATLAQTLHKKNVNPLTSRNFVFQLHADGAEGIHRRIQVVLHLMSNTQHLGLVVKNEYLHLSRSMAALAGTYLHLYRGLPRMLLLFDFLKTVAKFPAALIIDRMVDKRTANYLRLFQRVTFLPGFRKVSPRHLIDGTTYLPN